MTSWQYVPPCLTISSMSDSIPKVHQRIRLCFAIRFRFFTFFPATSHEVTAVCLDQGSQTLGEIWFVFSHHTSCFMGILMLSHVHWSLIQFLFAAEIIPKSFTRCPCCAWPGISPSINLSIPFGREISRCLTSQILCSGTSVLLRFVTAPAFKPLVEDHPSRDGEYQPVVDAQNHQHNSSSTIHAIAAMVYGVSNFCGKMRQDIYNYPNSGLSPLRITIIPNTAPSYSSYMVYSTFGNKSTVGCFFMVHQCSPMIN